MNDWKCYEQGRWKSAKWFDTQNHEIRETDERMFEMLESVRLCCRYFGGFRVKMCGKSVQTLDKYSCMENEATSPHRNISWFFLTWLILFVTMAHSINTFDQKCQCLPENGFVLLIGSLMFNKN